MKRLAAPRSAWAASISRNEDREAADPRSRKYTDFSFDTNGLVWALNVVIQSHSLPF
jgi:hypothetical protein